MGKTIKTYGISAKRVQLQRDNRDGYGGIIEEAGREGGRPLVWPLCFFKYIYFLRNASFTGLTRTKREEPYEKLSARDTRVNIKLKYQYLTNRGRCFEQRTGALDGEQPDIVRYTQFVSVVSLHYSFLSVGFVRRFHKASLRFPIPRLNL